MKIAYNPKTAAALAAAPNNDDIIFDLKGLNIFAKGEKFKGTDTTYKVFKKHTSANAGGYNGLVPVPSYTINNNRYLREDGSWVIPDKLNYTQLTDQDLNDYTYEGKWYYAGGSNSITNKPSEVNAFELYVGRTAANSRYQKLISVNGDIWYRTLSLSDNTWSTWQRWYTTDDKVLQVETTAAGFRSIILGATEATDPSELGREVIAKVWTNTKIYAQPSTGTLFATKFQGALDWSNIINKPATYTPSTHTHPSNLITALTGYTKATSISALTTADSLNTALGKLEYKSDLGVSAYNIVSAATDGDGTIENLNEILSVLQGISDTATIQGILGNYVTINTAQTIIGPKTFNSGCLSVSGSDSRVKVLTSTNTSISAESNDRIWEIYHSDGGAIDRGLVICSRSGDTENQVVRLSTYNNSSSSGNYVESGVLSMNGATETNSVVTAQGSVSGEVLTLSTSTTGSTAANTMFMNGTIQATAMIMGNGFMKAGSTDSYFLTGGGGHRSISDFVTTNTNLTITGIKTFLSGKLQVEGNENYSYVLTSVNKTIAESLRDRRWQVYHSNGTGAHRGLSIYSYGTNINNFVCSLSAYSIDSTLENPGNAINSFRMNGVIKATSTITGSGFIKSTSDDTYVLTGGGGHKKISDFMLKSEELNNNLTTITKSLKVTQAWMDTGISGTDLPANGTYIVLVSCHYSGYIYWGYFSGIMSWFREPTNDSDPDEIILHRTGHNYNKIIYLRTKILPNTVENNYIKLLISASSDLPAACNFTFKFKRII